MYSYCIVLNRSFNSDSAPIPNMKTSDFTLDEEVVRRLVERYKFFLLYSPSKLFIHFAI